MLPLDKPTPELLAELKKHGISEDDIDIALNMDLHFDGSYGESWLVANKEKQRLYCVSAPYIVSKNLDDISFNASDVEKKLQKVQKKNAKKQNEKNSEHGEGFIYFQEYDLTRTLYIYVDNFVTSNRLMAYDGLPYEKDESLSDEENKARETEHNKSLVTIVIGNCTNARKKRLFAFIDIIGRFQSKREVTAEDPIFEQFNLKCPKCGRVYKNQEARICEFCSSNKAVMKRLLTDYFWRYRWQAFVVFGTMLLNTIISLITPIINGQVLFDQVISEPRITETGKQLGTMHDEKWVFVFVFVLVILGILIIVNNVFQQLASSELTQRTQRDMKKDVFEAMQKQSLSFFNRNTTGGLINRVGYDAGQICGFFSGGLVAFSYHALTFIGLTIFLFIMNWKLTLIVFIPVPIIVMIFKFVLPKLYRMYTKVWRASHSLTSIMNDSLTGVRVVKAFAKETAETNRFNVASERHYDVNLQYNKMSLMIFPVISLLIGLSSKAIWGFGGIQVMQEYMTYGQFTTYFGYLGMIFGPLNFFTTFADSVNQTLNAGQRMYEVIDAVPDVSESHDPVPLEPMKGEIEFKNVCFHYTPNRPILKDVSFHIHPGDHVGLVGHTGAGKSTIANLINRLYDVISGTVELDGVNIREVKMSSLHHGIAIVSQEVFLFHGTILDNIRYARPDATVDECIEAAKIANAHQFITAKWEGYDTMIDGSGSLSGGERQRVAIARALLMDPKILILDEATAAMDTETERQIQEALEKLIKGRTTVSIAHRLSTLKDCNYLMAIENGEIAEQGTPDELLAKKGVYYRLYKLQSDAMKRMLQGM